MAEKVTTQYASGVAGALRRISWGAVFAGVVVAIMVSLILNLLGLGIGLTAIQITEEGIGAGLGVGAAIWWTISSLIALFTGGWVAGHLAGALDRADAALHGILTWGVASLVTLLFFTTAVGQLVGGATSMMARGFGVPGEQVMAQIFEPAGAATQQEQQTLREIQQEARQLLRQEQPAVFEEAQPGAAATPQAERQLDQALQRLLTGEQFGERHQANREAVIGILTAQGNVPRQEAEQAVQGWVSQYERASFEAEAAGAAPARVIEPGAVTEGLTAAAWWAFFALVLGGLAAAYGGRQAMRRYTSYIGTEGGAARPA